MINIIQSKKCSDFSPPFLSLSLSLSRFLSTPPSFPLPLPYSLAYPKDVLQEWLPLLRYLLTYFVVSR